MSAKSIVPLFLCSVFSLLSCRHITNIASPVNYEVHTFYYGWYGNPDNNGAYYHWNHQIIPHWIDSTWNNAGSYPGGDDIGANFYPQLGCYSSNNPELIAQHMKQIRKAGIGTIVLSWWGKDSYTDKSVRTYLDMAHRHHLKIAFHIEPIYKTTEEFRSHLAYLSEQYSAHPAVYKIKDKPFYYIYDAYKLNYRQWDSILDPASETSLRNTPLDAIFISLWTLRLDGEFAVVSGFDGVYTYYGSDGFAFGSTSSNWEKMAAYARENELIFIPCAGPGYLDTRIRPWNTKTTRNRENGRYYEKMFLNAVHTDPDFIGITSFNEWHEGTQIEPAVPKSISSFTYEDYGAGTDPMFYISKTRELVRIFSKRRRQGP